MFWPLGRQDPGRIENYEILAVLGEGGMGRVYLGREPGGPFLAIKVIKRELLAQGREFLDKFERELRAAQRIGCRFTPAVYDHDLDKTDPWIATLYQKAPTLRQLMTDESNRRIVPLPVEAVVWLGKGMAEALAAMSRVGVIHRDLHPSNVLVHFERPMLIDFGLARIVEKQMAISGDLRGAHGYVAPEQVHREAPPSHATDVYATTATLVFAATGAPPYVDGNHMVVRDRKGNPLIPNLPRELRKLVAEGLRRDPAERPSADQFRTALVSTLDGELGERPDDASAWLPPEAISRLRDHQEWSVLDRNGVKEPRRPSNMAATKPLPPFWRFRTGGAGCRAAPVAGEGTVVVAGLNGVVHGLDAVTGMPRWKHQVKGRLESEAAVGGGAVILASSDHHLHAFDAGSGRRMWQADLTPTVASSALIDGPAVFFGDRSGGVQARNLRDGGLRWRRRCGMPVHARPILTRGMVVVGSWDHRLYAFSAATGEICWKYPISAEIHSAGAADGDGVYFGGGDHRLHAVDLEGRGRWSFLTGGAVHSVPVVGDGAVYFCSADGCLYALDTALGSELWRLKAPGGLSSPPVLDRGRVYVGGQDGRCSSVSAGTGGDLRRSAPLQMTGAFPERRITGITAAEGQIFATTVGGDVLVFSPDDFLAEQA